MEDRASVDESMNCVVFVAPCRGSVLLESRADLWSRCSVIVPRFASRPILLTAVLGYSGEAISSVRRDSMHLVISDAGSLRAVRNKLTMLVLPKPSYTASPS